MESKVEIKHKGKFLTYKTVKKDGDTTSYEYVSRNKTEKGKADAVVVIAKTAPGFLCIKERRDALNEVCDDVNQIQFPAGIIDEGETPIEAAARELLEETGYELFNAVESPIMFNSAGMTDESCVIVYGQAYRVGEQNLQDNEQIEVIAIEDFAQLKRDYLSKGYPVSSKLLQHFMTLDIIANNAFDQEPDFVE